VKNHPLVDGNRRLGWLATAVFLQLNGLDSTRASNDDVHDFVIDVAGGHQSVAEIAESLHRIIG